MWKQIFLLKSVWPGRKNFFHLNPAARRRLSHHTALNACLSSSSLMPFPYFKETPTTVRLKIYEAAGLNVFATIFQDKPWHCNLYFMVVRWRAPYSFFSCKGSQNAAVFSALGVGCVDWLTVDLKAYHRLSFLPVKKHCLPFLNSSRWRGPNLVWFVFFFPGASICGPFLLIVSKQLQSPRLTSPVDRVKEIKCTWTPFLKAFYFFSGLSWWFSTFTWPFCSICRTHIKGGACTGSGLLESAMTWTSPSMASTLGCGKVGTLSLKEKKVAFKKGPIFRLIAPPK